MKNVKKQRTDVKRAQLTPKRREPRSEQTDSAPTRQPKTTAQPRPTEAENRLRQEQGTTSQQYGERQRQDMG